MSQLPITIVGNLAADPIQSKLPGGTLKTSLRVASSRRWAKTDSEGSVEWTETDLLFMDVDVWGPLGVHVKHSLLKGMPVIIVGSLNVSQYEDKEGNKRSKTVVRATSVGLDLNRYIVASRRMDLNKVPEGMSMPSLKDQGPDRDYSQIENGQRGHDAVADSEKDTAADSQAAKKEGAKGAALAGVSAPPF